MAVFLQVQNDLGYVCLFLQRRNVLMPVPRIRTGVVSVFLAATAGYCVVVLQTLRLEPLDLEEFNLSST